MNKKYIIHFHLPFGANIATEVKAENGDLALNQAQGMLIGEWFNIVDLGGSSLRVKTSEVHLISCERLLEVNTQ